MRPLWPVALILAAAIVIATVGAPLPPQFAGLRTAGPYTLVLAAVAVSLWFNRERAFVLALSLLVAFTAYDYVAIPLFSTAGAVLVPLNALAALSMPERGVRFGRAWRWVALVMAEAFVVYFLYNNVDADELLDNVLLREPAAPLAARVAFAAALAAAVWRAWPAFTPLELGIGGSLLAYFLASTWVADPYTYAVFMIAAGGVLLVAVLQESYRMAFRDALTGLPNRRALEEQLRALQPPYAIAMCDVDHFKKFNDNYGHDIGDQVLRLVASRLAETAGDGRAFRYGGEEFTVLFRGKRLSEVMPQLEAARGAVEMYKMTIRGEDRPMDKKEGAKRRGARPAENFERTDMLLSVTISIGGAEPGKRLTTPAEVVKGADEALYRAKERGRNRVSR